MPDPKQEPKRPFPAAGDSPVPVWVKWFYQLRAPTPLLLVGEQLRID